MANKKRGYYSLKIGGKNRTMHFSMNFWANFTDLLNIPLDCLSTLFEKGVSIKTIRTLIYSALLAYDQEEGNEIDYNEFKVGMWLEDFDGEKINDVVNAMTLGKRLIDRLGEKQYVKRLEKPDPVRILTA